MVDIADFRFNDPTASFRSGYDQTNALRQDDTNRQAGRALAGGDYAGGANALLNNGNLQQGLAVRGAGQAAEAQQAAAAQAQEEDLLKETAGAAGRLADFHREISQSDPQNATARTLAAFDQVAAGLKAKGATNEDLMHIRQNIQTDPEGTFAALGAGAAKQLGYEVQKADDGSIIAIDKSTGKAHLVASPAPQQGPAGQPGEGPPPTGQPAPAAASAPGGPVNADALWAAIKHQESGGEAHPGSAIGPDTPYGNAQGSTQMLPATAEAMARKIGVPWNPALMREDTPRALAYQDQLGRAYLQEGLDKSGGDPAAAAAYYYGGPDPKLHGPKTAAYVKAVLARANPQPYEVASNGPTPPPPSGGVPVGAVGPDGVLQLGPHKQDWVADGKGALINQKTGDRKKDPTFGGGADAQPDPNIVKMVIEGRYPVPTGRQAMDPTWLATLQTAAAQDPTFDAANYPTRVKTRQSFLNGKDAQNITALNTVVGHLGALDDSINHLGNFGGFPGSKLNNQAAHWIAEQSGTDQRFAKFTADKTAVANELTRVFRGSGGAEADIQGYLRQLDAASSPETLHTAVKAIAQLIHSRLDAVSDTYQQGMGLSKQPMEFLHPEQAKVFARLSGDQQQGQSQAQHSELPTLSPEEAAKLPSGAQFRGQDGVLRTRR